MRLVLVPCSVSRLELAALCLAALVPLGGCATITAPDEAEALGESATAFGEALKAADAAQSEARALAQQETYRTDTVLRGGTIAIDLDCRRQTKDAADAFDAVLEAAPYHSPAGDAAFRRLQQVKPCDAPGVQADRTPATPLDPRDLALNGAMSVGAQDLPRAARQLQRYTDALSDLATNKTGAEADAAQSQLITAGEGLLAALGAGGPLAQIGAAADQAINSIVAAKRNTAMRQFLSGMDPAMPALMERLGNQARVAQSAAAESSASAAYSIGSWMNDALNEPAYIMVASGGARRGTPERGQLFDDAAARLATYNQLFLSVTEEDPMKAAQGFAAAHHELTLVYSDPRASRRSVAQALASFHEAASALAEALKSSAKAEEGAAQ